MTTKQQQTKQQTTVTEQTRRADQIDDGSGSDSTQKSVVRCDQDSTAATDSATTTGCFQLEDFADKTRHVHGAKKPRPFFETAVCMHRCCDSVRNAINRKIYIVTVHHRNISLGQFAVRALHQFEFAEGWHFCDGRAGILGGLWSCYAVLHLTYATNCALSIRTTGNASSVWESMGRSKKTGKPLRNHCFSLFDRDFTIDLWRPTDSHHFHLCNQ